MPCGRAPSLEERNWIPAFAGMTEIASLGDKRYEFPIVQNPTSRGVFWTTGWNLRSEVLKVFVSSSVPCLFHVEFGCSSRSYPGRRLFPVRLPTDRREGLQLPVLSGATS
jgi:hypothetical protein